MNNTLEYNENNENDYEVDVYKITWNTLEKEYSLNIDLVKEYPHRAYQSLKPQLKNINISEECINLLDKLEESHLKHDEYMYIKFIIEFILNESAKDIEIKPTVTLKIYDNEIESETETETESEIYDGKTICKFLIFTINEYNKIEIVVIHAETDENDIIQQLIFYMNFYKSKNTPIFGIYCASGFAWELYGIDTNNIVYSGGQFIAIEKENNKSYSTSKGLRTVISWISWILTTMDSIKNIKSDYNDEHIKNIEKCFIKK